MNAPFTLNFAVPYPTVVSPSKKRLGEEKETGSPFHQGKSDESELAHCCQTVFPLFFIGFNQSTTETHLGPSLLSFYNYLFCGFFNLQVNFSLFQCKTVIFLRSKLYIVLIKNQVVAGNNGR